MAVMDSLYFDTSLHGDPLGFVNEDGVLDSLYPTSDLPSQVYHFNGNMDTNLDFWDGTSTSDLVDPRQTFNTALAMDSGLGINLFPQHPAPYLEPFQPTNRPITERTNATIDPGREMRKRKVTTNDDSQPDDDSAKPAPKKRRSRKRKPPPTPAEAEAKRQNFLRRNRAAAAKCRQKNREKVNGIQEKKIALETEHKILLMELEQAREQVDTLRQLVSMHVDCDHPEITRWRQDGGDLNPLAPQRPGLDLKMFQNPAEPTEEDGDRSDRSNSVDSMGDDQELDIETSDLQHEVPSVSFAFTGSIEDEPCRPSTVKVKRELPSPPDSAIDVSSPNTQTVDGKGGGFMKAAGQTSLPSYEALNKEFQEVQQFSRAVGW